ncbi:polyprenyl synthetase family protein [Oxyplasma meridianum]|uniref:Polyprenyl synthetase family protein n=1 Tax=Oxyplasma meridianum TaxID=3073602 RepID=A0AAX4NGK0_9ARCH
MKSFLEWEMSLSEKIEDVNRRLQVSIYTEEEALFSMAKYTLEAGGKRFRPLLIIIAYSIASGKDYKDILDLAAGYELIHTASLIHDDIIDKSELRRGRETLHVKEGVDNAIVVGDYLFAKAYELGSRYGAAVSKIMADASSRLAEGQILEAKNLGNLELTEETYLKIISKKTAFFFAACAEGAAVAANCNALLRKSLTDFAFNLGMAFQVTDDILDIVGSEEKMGKPVLVDIKHSAITLPIIYALRNSDEKNRIALEESLQGKDHGDDFDLKSYFLKTGSIDYSFKMARSYIERAMEALKKTGTSPDINLLMELALIVIERIEELA